MPRVARLIVQEVGEQKLSSAGVAEELSQLTVETALALGE